LICCSTTVICCHLPGSAAVCCELLLYAVSNSPPRSPPQRTHRVSGACCGTAAPRRPCRVCHWPAGTPSSRPPRQLQRGAAGRRGRASRRCLRRRAAAPRQGWAASPSGSGRGRLRMGEKERGKGSGRQTSARGKVIKPAAKVFSKGVQDLAHRITLVRRASMRGPSSDVYETTKALAAGSSRCRRRQGADKSRRRRPRQAAADGGVVGGQGSPGSAGTAPNCRSTKRVPGSWSGGCRPCAATAASLPFRYTLRVFKAARRRFLSVGGDQQFVQTPNGRRTLSAARRPPGGARARDLARRGR
jgi:hypothetical protein